MAVKVAELGFRLSLKGQQAGLHLGYTEILGEVKRLKHGRLEYKVTLTCVTLRTGF